MVNLDQLKVLQGKTCFLSGIVTVLRYFNCAIKEEVLLGLGVGLQFRFGYEHVKRENSYQSDGNPIVICSDIMLDKTTLILFCQHFGFKIEELIYREEKEMYQAIQDEIGFNRPIIISVDSYYLDYWPEHLKQHSGHFIICYGWDELKNRALIADTFIPTIPPRVYQGEMLLSRLKNAINPPEVLSTNYLLACRLVSDAKSGPITELEILKSFQFSKEAFFSRQKESYSLNDSIWIFHSGLHGMKHLLTEIEYISKSPVNKKDVQWLISLFPYINSISGPVIIRSLYASYLEWVHKEKEISIEPLLIDEYKELSKKWLIIAYLLLKTANSGNLEHLLRISRRLREIINKERELILQLP